MQTPTAALTITAKSPLVVPSLLGSQLTNAWRRHAGRRLEEGHSQI